MEKKDEKAEKGEPSLSIVVVTTEVVVVEEKIQEKPEEKEQKRKNRWNLIAAVLVIGTLAFLWISVDHYDRNIQSQLAGDYIVTRGQSDIPIDIDLLRVPIDGDYSLRTAIANGSNGNIFVVLSLASRSGNPSGSYENYQIEKLVLEGKKIERLVVKERIIPGTSVIAIFNASVPELGHTLNLEISVDRINSSTDHSSSFFYNIEILRESSGKIYYLREKNDALQKEPGFEGIVAVAAIAIIAVAIRRKKE